VAFRELEYQARVLRVFEGFLDVLAEQKRKADDVARLAAEHPDMDLPVPDFAERTWEALRSGGSLPASRTAVPYSPRRDGLGRPVPNTVFKVPTGGGKTFLAASAVSRIFGRYLGRNSGFVLWLAPNEAIYSQTLRHLNDRQHPYRQMLDRSAAGRVLVLEKDSPLDARDVGANLCVMLLMLQSANRQTRETLKMFQDRGDVHGFFPDEGDQEAHRKALEATRNLDAYSVEAGAGSLWPMVKDSLGNALRLIRPVVVMDEGHRAVADLAFETLYGFNPCFVLELTATPKDVAARGGRRPLAARPANVLVEVSGVELDREGMIKMPLNLDPRQGADWRTTLAAALQRLNRLDRRARQLRADTGRYIRPILLVQVERTGAEQRDGRLVHAEDAREWLMAAGLDEAEIAVKTASTNDLDAPENQDLLSPTNRVRAIITKQALQEGWDCPFAYVLCSLAGGGNFSAMTQLVGRILRQPYAEKTGIAALDECYVLTHHAETAAVVTAVKRGLEADGLGDLVQEIRLEDTSGAPSAPRVVERRDKFSKTQIFLPLVTVVDGKSARALDYDADVLAGLDWRGMDSASLANSLPSNPRPADGQMRRFRLTGHGEDRIVAEAIGPIGTMEAFDPAYAVRMVSDIVPNPWVAREIVGSLCRGLEARGLGEAWLGQHAGFLVEELRKWLSKRRDDMAEARFRASVTSGRIQFRLRADDRNWAMPKEIVTTQLDGARQLMSRTGGPLERSLFVPIYEADFSSADEREVAVYLDGEQALNWWHRNVARQQYYVQGWRRDRIYPDFIFAVQRGVEQLRIAVVEVKGEHLVGDADSTYKQAVLELVSEHFSASNEKKSGNLQIQERGKVTVECAFVPLADWKARLPTFFED
jgi:type III restriction enzyme